MGGSCDFSPKASPRPYPDEPVGLAAVTTAVRAHSAISHSAGTGVRGGVSAQDWTLDVEVAVNPASRPVP